MKNQFETKEEVYKLLTKSDHFGEINTIYDCPSTATVISRNYNTMSNIAPKHYKQLVSDFREY